MRFTQRNLGVAHRVIEYIRKNTDAISDGEAAAITAWWRFINDHALTRGMDPEVLAREQLEAFLKFAKTNLRAVEVQLPEGHA